MNEEILNLGNARLLYGEFELDTVNWQKEDGNLLHYIESYPRLQLAHDFTYLYFFSSSEKNESLWLAREIVGFPSSLDHGYQTYDLKSGRYIRHSEEMNWFDISLSKVEELGRLRYIDLKSLYPLASEWRICIDWQVSTPKIYFEYFFKD